jgi:hypothetical protein
MVHEKMRELLVQFIARAHRPQGFFEKYHTFHGREGQPHAEAAEILPSTIQGAMIHEHNKGWLQ